MIGGNEQALLNRVANETNRPENSLKWQPIRDNGRVRSIVVKERGTNKLIMTISQTNNSHLWESWQPVIADWKLRKETNGARRVRHDVIGQGKV